MHPVHQAGSAMPAIHPCTSRLSLQLLAAVRSASCHNRRAFIRAGGSTCCAQYSNGQGRQIVAQL